MEVPSRIEAPAVDQVDYRAETISRTCAADPADRRARDAACAIVVDCANGATTTMAPRLFRELGFDVRGHRRRARRPQHQPATADRRTRASSRDAVVDDGHALGIAFDGDGDRAIFVDDRGHVVDGDAVMLMCAKQMQRDGRLKGNAIVATVMSNIGLEIALRDAGIEHACAARSATST